MRGGQRVRDEDKLPVIAEHIIAVDDAHVKAAR